MIGSTLAQHAPLIYDTLPPGIAPPAPPQPPQPPVADPIAFNVVTRPRLFGIVGDAISSTTMATVTCVDASMTILQSEPVPGLTFSYAANVLSVAGTPTGPSRVHRVVFSYMSSDGDYTVRGSTSHEITIVDTSEVLTIGDMAGAGGRVGIPLSVTLANLSANYLVNVTAHPGVLIPGLAASLAWTPDATSTGVLTLAGTPTFAGTYSLTVNFRAGAIDLGTSTHSVVIAPAYEVAPPAPAPAPAPPAPAPVPPPAPTPAPAPGLGPDPFIDDVKVLMHFNNATGLVYDEKGNTFTNSGATATTGAVLEGALLQAGNSIYATVPDCDGSDGYLAADALVDIDATAWAALNAPGSAERYCPVLSYISSSNTVVWTIGFGSWMVQLQGVTTRIVVPIGYSALTSAIGRTLPFKRVMTLSNAIAVDMPRPAKFVHLCMARAETEATPTAFTQASWFGGNGAFSNDGGVIANLVSSPAGRVQIGGFVPAMQPLVNVAPQIVAFSGVVDEVRITANGANRYGSATLTDGSNLSPLLRVIPWPNH